MAEYYVMLRRKYKLPVRQFVVFIGAGTPKMQTSLVDVRMQFDFPLVVFAELDYLIFLKSDRAEEVVLAILADFKQENAETAINQIVRRIRETTDGEFSLRRHYQQLRILAQLRSLEEDLNEMTMDSLLKYVSVERDPLYKMGVEKGEERFVRYLFLEMNLTTDQVADVAGVSVDFVEKVKAMIAAEK